MTQRDKIQTTLTNYFGLLSSLTIALLMGIYDLLVILYHIGRNVLALVGLIVWPAVLLVGAATSAYIRFCGQCGLWLHRWRKSRNQRAERQPAEPKASAAMGSVIFTEWTATEFVEVPA